MTRDVLLKFLKKKRVNDGGSVMRDLIWKARIESQSMARAAMFGVSDWDHIRAANLLRRGNIRRVRPRACRCGAAKFPSLICTRGAMAIAAIQLDGAARAFQIMAQVNRVVQLDGSGIRIGWAQSGEFGMSTVKASNFVRELWRWSARTQIRVALRAARFSGGRETHMAAMLLMA